MRWILSVLGALLVAGCGTETIRDPVAPGPADLVLRATTVGGIAGLGGKGTLPDVSVYGDGRAIARGDRWPAEYRLTRPAYDRLVAGARKAGLGTPRTIEDPHVADALYTVITFADLTPRTTRVVKSPRGGAAAAFADRLDPKSWTARDLSAAVRPYHPAKVAVLAVPAPGLDGARAWPFGALGTGLRIAQQTCTVLTGKDAVKAQGLTGRIAWSRHGHTYQVTFRPLLPDEADCAALAR